MAVNSRAFLRKLVNNEIKKANEILETLYGARYEGRKISAFVQGTTKKYESLMRVKGADPNDRYFSTLSDNTHMTAKQLQDRFALMSEFTEGKRWDGWDINKIIDEAESRAERAGMEVDDFLDFWKLARDYDFDYIGDSETFVELAQEAYTQVGAKKFKAALTQAKKQAKTQLSLLPSSQQTEEVYQDFVTKQQRATIRRLLGIIG